MPKRIVRLINRNPGIAGVLSSILFVAPAYVLWYHENQQTNAAIECVVQSLGTRDAVTIDNRDTLIQFFDEFGKFLRNIEGQTSARPLLKSSDDAEASLRKVTVAVNAQDLESCLNS